MAYYAAHPDDPEAAYWVARLDERGLVEAGDETALFIRAAELGHPAARVTQACLYMTATVNEQRDVAKGLRMLHELLGQGEPDAALQLGLAYLRGIGVGFNAREAERYLLTAKAMGHKQAHYFLALLYERQGRIPEMLSELSAGAEAAYVPAQVKLAEFYRDGAYVEPDPFQAVRWTLAAANQGHKVMQRELAEMILRGYGGVTQNESRAIQFFQAAAERGDVPAQLAIAQAQIEGLYGLEPDPVKGLGTLARLAEEGHAEAQYRLARLHLESDWVRRDEAEARRLLEAAAAQGHEGAQSLLPTSATRPASTQPAPDPARRER